jgi:hypothetical protein
MAARKRKTSKKQKAAGEHTHRLVMVSKSGKRSVIGRGTKSECNAMKKSCGRLGVCIVEAIR